IDFSPFHLIVKLPRIRRECFDIAALALGIDCVERKRTLSGTAQAGDNRKRIARDFDVDVFQIMLAGAMHRDSFEHCRETSIVERTVEKQAGGVRTAGRDAGNALQSESRGCPYGARQPPRSPCIYSPIAE